MNSDPIAETMRVVADITRRDILVVGIRYMLSARWVWASCGLGFAACLWSQWHSQYRPTQWSHAVGLIVVFAAIWLGFVFVVAFLTAVAMVCQASAQSGILGRHTFEIRPDGLFESTSANQTLTSWSAIPRAIRTEWYILVSLTWWLFHYIPRRAFPDETAYDAFFRALQQRITQDA
jgi:hypothetical protein